MNVDELLGRLEGVRRSGRGWSARCPAHEDRHASLSVALLEGKLLLHCHAGCPTERIVSRLGLRIADLFSDAGKGSPTRPLPQQAALPSQYCSAPQGQRRRPTNGPRPTPARPSDCQIGPLDWLAVYCGVPRSFLDLLPLVLTPDGSQIGFIFPGLRSHK